MHFFCGGLTLNLSFFVLPVFVSLFHIFLFLFPVLSFFYGGTGFLLKI